MKKYELNKWFYNSTLRIILKGNEIVVPSRFIEGGEMKDCPLIKSILVRLIKSTFLSFISHIQIYQN